MQKNVRKPRRHQRRNNFRSKKQQQPAGPKKCQVCKAVDAKYKCPTCRIPFCSVPCSKKHKEVKCTPVEAPLSPAFPPKSGGESKKMLDIAAPRRFEDDDVNQVKLADDQLAMLDADPVIQRKLKDSRLVHAIRVIRDAKEPRAALDVAIQDPEFLEFCDEILACVGYSYD